MKTLSTRTRLGAAMAVAISYLILPQAQAVPVNLDLTAGGTQTFAGAIWSTTEVQPAGSGVIEPFLRLQARGSETGLNSGEQQSDLLADTKSGTWTSDIMLSGLGQTTIEGETYYAFLLDMNQDNNDPLLSLDTFQLYTRPTSITDGEQDTLADVQNGGVLRYDLDAGMDRGVLLDDENSGSGEADLFVYIPTSFFAGASMDDYVYLYNQFGLQEGYESNGGFEEWATQDGATSVPDSSATVLMVGMGMLLIGFARRFVK